jgi:hypothetical protein
MVEESPMRNAISTEIWHQVKTAYAAGIGLREIARNMNMAEGTVLARAKREGWTAQIQTAKHEAQPLQSDAITPMQAVAITMQQRGHRHAERIAGVTDSVLPHLERMPPAAILDGIHEIEKYDRMARRNYGMTDSTGSGGSLSLRVLTGPAVIEVTK